MRLLVDQRSGWRYTSVLLFAVVATVSYSSLASSAPQIDACRLVDSASVNAVASAWFGMPLKFQISPAPGPRGGTCDFETDTPKHIDFTVFYAPRANASMYGFNRQTPQGMVTVNHLGDSALFRQSSDPSDRYKSEDLAVLKGTAVLDLNMTLDKGLPFVEKEKLVEFAAKLVPKM